MHFVSFNQINPDIKGIYSIHVTPEPYFRGEKYFYTSRLLLFRRGHGIFRFQNAVYHTHPGCVLYIPAMERYTTDIQEELDIVHLCFDFIPCHAGSEILVKPVYNESMLNRELLREPICITDAPIFQSSFLTEDFPDMEERAVQILQEYNKRLRGYVLRCRGMLIDTLVTLLRMEAAPSHTRTGLTVTEEILVYIRENCESPLDREELSRIFHYHPNHINRLVLQATGMTLYKYILDVRLHRAEILLASTSLPITQIAQQLSFYDSSHFSAVFQKYKNILPNEYRRLSREMY